MTPALFLTASDTGVGKTYVACRLAEAFRASGQRVGVLKPFAAGGWDDARNLHRAAGVAGPLRSIVVHFSPRPLATAATLGLGGSARRIADAAITESRLRLNDLRGRNDAVLVEGFGGVLAPLGGDRTVADLIGALRVPVWLVVRPGLGTLNHTALSLEALHLRGFPVARVIVSGYRGRTEAERSNRRLLPKLSRAPVTVLPWGRPRWNKALLRAAFQSDFGRERACS